MRRSGRTRLALLLAVGMLSSALGILVWATGALNEPELDTVDLRFALRGDDPPPADLVVVGVDDVTFADRPNTSWPFPRRLHARVIDRLAADGAAVIAYDVQFTERTNARDDFALVRSVERATDAGTEVVLATTETGPGGRTNVFGGDGVVRSVGAVVGNANLTPDGGGVVRRTPYEMGGLESFGVRGAEAAGAEVDPADFASDGAWIDFHGPPGTIETFSFSRVLEGRFEPGAFDGRTVVVGTTAPSLQDVHPTAVGRDELMSGPEVQASAISTVARGLPLGQSPEWLDVPLIVLFGMLAPVAAIALSPVRGLALAVAVGLAYAAVVQLGFNAGLILPFVAPVGALTLAAAGTVTVHYVTAAVERQRTRDIFARFVPEKVVDRVLAGADEDLRLGGVEVEGTILFSDIRGFTTFSEEHPAAEVLGILNRYLSAMTDTIMAHGGTLTTYIGDGIMAVFGAPIEQSDHADRALATAREMLEREMPAFNRWLAERGIDSFRIGIGLNTGRVMAGNVGSERRLEYTAIGDAVNTAARLEGMTKDSPHDLFVADSTREQLSDPEQLTYVDELAVRGRRSSVAVWGLAGAGEPEREA